MTELAKVKSILLTSILPATNSIVSHYTPWKVSKEKKNPRKQKKIIKPSGHESLPI